ncbi:MAG: response regulator, partial [Candidatus Sericytochromatia bacterium]|nr:response regulator [Candidatus Tanganyikabacteria bacterium]
MNDSGPRKIRVLVVDDSAYMCRAIRRMVEGDPALEVVGEARDGTQCLERIAALSPDVVTLDVEMPVMDGLTALREIVAKFRTKVVMLSSLTHVGSDTALQSLELGAFDFVPKPGDSAVEIFRVAKELTAKIRAAASASASAWVSPAASPPASATASPAP